MKIKILPLVLFVGLCLGVGYLGSIFTINSIPTWYVSLNKPVFSPPNFLFAPVWTILYILMGISVYLIWEKGIKKKTVKAAVIVFATQLFLNFLWSIIFFGYHLPLLAFIDILLLWGLILLTIVKFRPLSKTAAYLLIPYILWVSFATILNLFIVILNK